MFYTCLSVHRGVSFPACITGHMIRMVCIGGGWADPPRSAYGGGDWADPPRDIWDTMGYGQQAGGTHPTGMLSCTNFFPNRLR